VLYAKSLFEQGFYTSPIFFPVIAKGRAGLRIMVRANMEDDDVRRFASALNQLKNDHE
jgi:7-keto-8-aminopelargonate synthetase-like enzyme